MSWQVLAPSRQRGRITNRLWRGEGNETKIERVNLLIPPGKWLAVYAASVVDGSAVAVEHWAGEIVDPFDDGGSDKKDAGPPKSAKKGKGVSKTLRYRVLERDGFRCRSCGKTSKEDGVKLEADHVVAEALGGAAALDNLQTLCQDCNRGKGAR